MVIKALLFDVFGTVVDWRTSITREVAAFGQRHRVTADWESFADNWREGYSSGMAQVNDGEVEWRNVDRIHRERLDLLLAAHGFPKIAEYELDQLNRAWHRLDAWPDAVEGLLRLKSDFVISTLSNGHLGLLVNMAKQASLPWDCVLSSELSGRYKPDLAVYRYAARILDLSAEEVMMVAAHVFDVEAAAQAGLRTAFVSRPLEYGNARAAEVAPAGRFDIEATDFNDLANQLGCA
jgi:2-haloacid dehalogenase